jgi:type I restriction enzyme R subunit
LKEHDVHIAAFRHFFELDNTDDVDILSKVGFDFVQVPERHDRVNRLWDEDGNWLMTHVSELALPEPDRFKTQFWQTSLDHYALFGIDDLEQGSTYSAPQFVERFGSFSSLLSRYGGANVLKADLEEVKAHLYVPMAS